MPSSVADSRHLILGSASPRRAALLSGLGIDFTTEAVDIDEAALVGPNEVVGERSVERIALAKFATLASAAPAAGSARPAGTTVITADTLVACNGSIMGKPTNDANIADLLTSMSGQPLTISTAVCVGSLPDEPVTHVVSTIVRLRVLEPHEIQAYVESGQGRDKAGGLALQGHANTFIDAVDGCWSNVVGLPLCAVAAALDLGESGESQPQRCTHELCASATATQHVT